MTAAASLSVVIPVYDEPEWIGPTVDAVARAIEASPFDDCEIVIVDDGSGPATTQALAALSPPVDLRLLSQENAGRFAARRAGVEAARGEFVLLLDARVQLDRDALRFVAGEIAAGRRVWNGHCMIDTDSGRYARFWEVLTTAAFPDYLRNPRHVTFGPDEYDRFPKGTGHFLAPRAYLLDAIDAFASLYSDDRFSSDDTHLLRHVAAREPINLAPDFASTYHSRTSMRPFLRHAFHRGTTFVDGFARPGSRFFPVLVSVLPVSLAALAMALRYPRLMLGGTALVTAAGAGFATHLGRPPRDAVDFGVLLPPFGIVYAAGIWRGVLMALRVRTGR